MSFSDFSISPPTVGPDGRYREQPKIIDVDRRSPSYILRSIVRLCLFADIPVTASKEQVCRLVKAYGYLLPAVQKQALEAWCKGNY